MPKINLKNMDKNTKQQPPPPHTISFTCSTAAMRVLVQLLKGLRGLELTETGIVGAEIEWGEGSVLGDVLVDGLDVAEWPDLPDPQIVFPEAAYGNIKSEA